MVAMVLLPRAMVGMDTSSISDSLEDRDEEKLTREVVYDDEGGLGHQISLYAGHHQHPVESLDHVMLLEVMLWSPP